MTAGREKRTADENGDASRRPLWFAQYFIVTWCTATGVGVLAALWASTAPTRPGGPPKQIVDFLTCVLLLVLLVLFAFAGVWNSWKALLEEKTEDRRAGLEHYLVIALALLFLVLPLSISAAWGHGSAPVVLAVVAPVIVNLLVAHRALRNVPRAPQLQEPIAHYILTGAVLGVILFAFLGLSFFNVLPEQLNEAWTAVILAASLLLLPEAAYVHLLVTAARRTAAVAPTEAPQPTPGVRADGHSSSVRLRVTTTRRRFGLIREQHITGVISDKT